MKITKKILLTFLLIFTTLFTNNLNSFAGEEIFIKDPLKTIEPFFVLKNLAKYFYKVGLNKTKVDFRCLTNKDGSPLFILELALDKNDTLSVDNYRDIIYIMHQSMPHCLKFKHICSNPLSSISQFVKNKCLILKDEEPHIFNLDECINLNNFFQENTDYLNFSPKSLASVKISEENHESNWTEFLSLEEIYGFKNKGNPKNSFWLNYENPYTYFNVFTSSSVFIPSAWEIKVNRLF